jgi:NADPH:quinone reductase-like Zn-dependent oxidoreductase
VPNPSAVLYGPGDVRIEDRPVPEPGSGEVQVEVTAIGVCGSDVHYYDHGRIGSHVVESPMVQQDHIGDRWHATGARRRARHRLRWAHADARVDRRACPSDL